jgi:amino acid adenylation domain-containing protein
MSTILEEQASHRTETITEVPSVVDLFTHQARSVPDAIALVHEKQALSYGELDHLSGCLAQRLHQAGLQPEESVAIMLERSVDFVIASLGVLKAGGTCVPLDIDLPDQMISFMLSDTNSKVIIGKSQHLEPFEKAIPHLLPIDNISNDFSDGLRVGEEMHLIRPSQRAYVIYTSGSTGDPKGVEIEHRALSNLVAAWVWSFQMTSNDRPALLSNVAFDAMLADLWPGLSTGSTLMIPPRNLFVHHDCEGLIDWLVRDHVTIAFVVPGMLGGLFESIWPRETSVRFLISGGDTILQRPPRDFPCAFINGYGPTENTVYSTISQVSCMESDQLPPIGVPIGNVRAYVLDRNQDPVAPGSKGELYLGGDQVARGYLNLPALTSERFLMDPFSEDPSARMYRTGDWVREHPDGQLEFLGRCDDQVQLGGIRIELEGITTKLSTHPSVREACCRPVLEGGLCKRIIAHVVPKELHEGLAEELRSHLLQRLPTSDVPYAFCFHEELPMTSRGKIDRAALDRFYRSDIEYEKTSFTHRSNRQFTQSEFLNEVVSD